MLLTKFVGGQKGVVEAWRLETTDGTTKCPWPLNWFHSRPVTIDERFVTHIKWGALQYSIIVPICAVVAVAAQKAGYYDEGSWTVGNVYVWTTLVINCSQMVALYALIWLYHGIHESIQPFRPLYKFLAVKAVVFLTFWQGVVLSGLADTGEIHATAQFTTDEQEVHPHTANFRGLASAVCLPWSSHVLCVCVFPLVCVSMVCLTEHHRLDRCECVLH